MPAALVEMVAAHETTHAAARKFVEHDGEGDRRAERTVGAAHEAGDDHDDGREEQPSLHHVDRDVALYGRGRVHGLPSSSRAMRAR